MNWQAVLIADYVLLVFLALVAFYLVVKILRACWQKCMEVVNVLYVVGKPIVENTQPKMYTMQWFKRERGKTDGS